MLNLNALSMDQERSAQSDRGKFIRLQMHVITSLSAAALLDSDKICSAKHHHTRSVANN